MNTLECRFDRCVAEIRLMTPEKASVSAQLEDLVTHPRIAEAISRLLARLLARGRGQCPPQSELEAYAKYEIAKMICGMKSYVSVDQVVRLIQGRLSWSVRHELDPELTKDETLTSRARQYERWQKKATTAGIPPLDEAMAEFLHKPAKLISEYKQAWQLKRTIIMHCREVIASEEGFDIGFPEPN